MKTRQKIKILIDLIMTILLLFLMAYHLTGQAAHERLGTGMFVLFIAHNLLNRRWYSGLLKGQYTPYRVLQTAINLLVLFFMLMQMASGVILSQHVFGFLHITGFTSLSRTLHLLGAYWGFPLLSMHLGLHWNMVLAMASRAAGNPAPSKPRAALMRTAAVLLAIYGLIAFGRYGLLSYMLLQNQFVFFDYEQSFLSFFSDYLAMMELWIFAAHYAGKLARGPKQTRKPVEIESKIREST